MEFNIRQTVFSPDRIYRYTLWRSWCPGMFGFGGEPLPSKIIQWIGLNPSTADETQDDPTVRRCINYAKAWGYDAMVMTNLFAYRATDPKDMLKQPYPIGHENDTWLMAVADQVGMAVAAWGNSGQHMMRSRDVRLLIQNLYCLKKTSLQEPAHPLYLKASLKPILLNSN